jgi:glycosyltransferase involved in cell wall biosynthesis
MKCVAVVPTANRPGILHRALSSFLETATRTEFQLSCIVVADDSIDPSRNSEVVQSLCTSHPNLLIKHLIVKGIDMGSRGPGQTRTEGLKFLTETSIDHEAIFLFDDDISFMPCLYQGKMLNSEGSSVLQEAVLVKRDDRTVLGCSYVGRQDLSLLAHIRLLSGRTPGTMLASSERNQVPHVAPGGISGAFLYVPTNAAGLPPFLPWYNEDYFWLKRMESMGWSLKSSGHLLAHAPEDGLHVSLEKLWFEQYGEALWHATADLTSPLSVSTISTSCACALRERISEIEAVRVGLQIAGDAAAVRAYSPVLKILEEQFGCLLEDLIAEREISYVQDTLSVLSYLKAAPRLD